MCSRSATGSHLSAPSTETSFALACALKQSSQWPHAATRLATANNFFITKRLEGHGLSLKDTQYALDLAARFMAEDSKPTCTPAKTYLTAAADLALNIDEKKEQKEHIAMLLSFYKTHKDNGDRGRKDSRGDGGCGRGRGRGGGGGGNSGPLAR